MPVVTLLYFASLRERLGCERETIELPEQTDDRAVLSVIGERHPELRDLLTTCRLAVDHAFVRGAVTIREGAEVALIPPVSGG
jgi:MoaE-MoaD fusion protein